MARLVIRAALEPECGFYLTRRFCQEKYRLFAVLADNGRSCAHRNRVERRCLSVHESCVEEDFRFEHRALGVHEICAGKEFVDDSVQLSE